MYKMDNYYLLSYILSLKLNGNIDICKKILSIIYPYKSNYNMCIKQIDKLQMEWRDRKKWRKPHTTKILPFYKYNLTKCYRIWNHMESRFNTFNYRYIRCYDADDDDCDFIYCYNIYLKNKYVY